MAGSHYPILLAFETYRQNFHYIRESRLPVEDVDKILNHNAQILLGLPHRAPTGARDVRRYPAVATRAL